MFKLSADPRFTHEVKVMVPIDGGHEEQSFKATFKVMSLDALTADEAPAASDAEAQAASLRKVIVDLQDLIDEADKPVPYSDKLRDELIGIPYIRVALMRTYITAITKVRAGN